MYYHSSTRVLCPYILLPPYRSPSPSLPPSLQNVHWKRAGETYNHSSHEHRMRMQWSRRHPFERAMSRSPPVVVCLCLCYVFVCFSVPVLLFVCLPVFSVCDGAGAGYGKDGEKWTKPHRRTVCQRYAQHWQVLPRNTHNSYMRKLVVGLDKYNPWKSVSSHQHIHFQFRWPSYNIISQPSGCHVLLLLFCCNFDEFHFIYFHLLQMRSWEASRGTWTRPDSSTCWKTTRERGDYKTTSELCTHCEMRISH